MGYFTSGNIGKISSVLSTDMVFIEEVSMSTIGNMMSYMPVSYTHLDVYKRQKYDSRHTLVNRIKAGVCEICGEHADYLCMADLNRNMRFLIE